ncbi:MAG: hypothetical protein FJ077_04100 [Cyanobacteria bacterium K_DeepCast_35m_m2_023]|nr:hypothetical protein [Cyanobacteria bacterium K_DeepCast_35m_m2_023]
MATAAHAACAPEVLQQIRRTLAEQPIAELGSLTPRELHSLAELICALSEPGGVFRAQFERLSSRSELVALAASRGIPVEPSLLERFEQLVGANAARELEDRELAAVSAGASDQALLGFQRQLGVWLEQVLVRA